MTKFYAQFAGAMTPNVTDTVSEVWPDPMIISGFEFPLDQVFTQEYRDSLIECPADTLPGATYDRELGVFTNPPALVAEPEAE